MEKNNRKIPRIMVAGTSSGSGKTTVTVGLIGALRKKGYKVQPYKVGPDYIDTGYLTHSASVEALNLDIWLTGKDNLMASFINNSDKFDIAVIEGVMGLFDGGDYSTAVVSKYLKVPVLLCIDSEKIGESVSAVIKGFLEFDPGVNIIGVVLTKVSGLNHYKLLKESIEKNTALPVLGYMQKDHRLAVKERHLGLKTVYEKSILEGFMDSVTRKVEDNFNLEQIILKSNKASRLDEENLKRKSFKFKDYKKYNIKVAYSLDKAFNFFYYENIKIMEDMGVECKPFSPLNDLMIDPDIDPIILWGGFPEIFAPEISGNKTLLRQIKQLIDDGKPVYAECGGLIYLSDNFISNENKKYPMVGVLPIEIKLSNQLAGFGYKEAEMRFDTIIGRVKTKVKGHEFHHSFAVGKVLESTRPYSVKSRFGNKDIKIEGYTYKNVFASYLHLHFLGNREVLYNIFDFIIKNR